MREPENRLTGALTKGGVGLLLTLPCDRVKGLIVHAASEIQSLQLTREEEGVGISAGAQMAGRRAAMLVQSSGVGNMINALMSLTTYYGLPLPVFVSHRGIYKEGIAAQVPMGRALTPVLDALGFEYTKIDGPEGLDAVADELNETYDKGIVRFFLLSPAIWECSDVTYDEPAPRAPCQPAAQPERPVCPAPTMSRYRLLKAIAPALKDKAVVCNLGVPSKELYGLMHQPSNFYMLGSMGMAAPIGLGAALCTNKEVIVIDGDGSLLMNPGTLATIAHADRPNLKIIAIDNASYGSTGNQPTLSASSVDLRAVARGFGIKNTIKTSEPEAITEALSKQYGGPLFIHALALSGNEPVPDIPLSAKEIRDGFSRFLKS